MPSKRAPVISAPKPQRSPANFQPLSLPSLDFSLTAGTNIPSPPATPTQDEIDLVTDANAIVRSPTPGGGPLSSHPTTPVAMPGAYPSSPTSTELKAYKVLGRDPGDKTDSAFASQSQLPFPREPSAAALPMSLPGGSATSIRGGPGASSIRSSFTGKKGSMRRLFSLRSLYSSSNGSSTDCFSGGAGNASSQQLNYDPRQPTKLPRMSSSDSFMQPYRPASSMASGRPDSRMTDVSDATGSKSPGLKSKRSSTFFGSSGRRKSALFMFGKVDENGMIAENTTMEEEEKENIMPPPTIQEVNVDTNIGGEELFRDIK